MGYKTYCEKKSNYIEMSECLACKPNLSTCEINHNSKYKLKVENNASES